MSDNYKDLYSIADSFKKMSQKIKLITLITKAKKEYDSYDYANALITLTKAYELDAKNPAILRGLGCLKQFEKKYDEALSYYKEALNYSRSKDVEYTLMGMVYYFQEKFDDAINCFNNAIIINDDNEIAYDTRNQAILEQHLKMLDLQDILKKYF